MTSAEMWFDPMCQWAWLTSRWLLEVERVRGIRLRLHVMSLAVLNEGRHDQSADESRWYQRAWGPVRVATAVALTGGQPAVRDFYAAIGGLIHKDGRAIDRELYAFALGASGLPHSLANAAQTAHYDEQIRASHRAGAAPLGALAACPITHVAGAGVQPVAFMGPLVTPYPRGEAAGRLWDAVMLAASTDEFFELRRLRSRPAIID